MISQEGKTLTGVKGLPPRLSPPGGREEQALPRRRFALMPFSVFLLTFSEDVRTKGLEAGEFCLWLPRPTREVEALVLGVASAGTGRAAGLSLFILCDAQACSTQARHLSPFQQERLGFPGVQVASHQPRHPHPCPTDRECGDSNSSPAVHFLYFYCIYWGDIVNRII